MRVLVTGAAGQLGYDVCRELARRGIEHMGTDRTNLNICDKAAVKACLIAYAPDAVIHCAAYTAVDRAEYEPELCFAVNVDGTQNLAEVCKQLEVKMLYISTDYVFSGDGEQLYQVSDAPTPINVYGKSKLAGENVIKGLLDRYFIVRASWMFGWRGNNFVKSILNAAVKQVEIPVVCDQIGSPTYTVDLAALLCNMVRTEKYGVYHATNEGVCSWAEFAEEILKQAGKAVRVKHIPTKDYQAKAGRPLNSRLSKQSLDASGFERLPAWQDALQRYLKEAKEVVG